MELKQSGHQMQNKENKLGLWHLSVLPVLHCVAGRKYFGYFGFFNDGSKDLNSQYKEELQLF